jgi:hypothetical protein
MILHGKQAFVGELKAASKQLVQISSKRDASTLFSRGVCTQRIPADSFPPGHSSGDTSRTSSLAGGQSNPSGMTGCIIA